MVMMIMLHSCVHVINFVQIDGHMFLLFRTFCAVQVMYLFDFSFHIYHIWRIRASVKLLTSEVSAHSGKD